MNYDDNLKLLSLVLMLLLSKYEAEIRQIKDPKHKIELIQELDKAKHYMLKMTKCFDDMNCWFTAFGVGGRDAKDS